MLLTKCDMVPRVVILGEEFAFRMVNVMLIIFIAFRSSPNHITMRERIQILYLLLLLLILLLLLLSLSFSRSVYLLPKALENSISVFFKDFVFLQASLIISHYNDSKLFFFSYIDRYTFSVVLSIPLSFTINFNSFIKFICVLPVTPFIPRLSLSLYFFQSMAHIICLILSLSLCHCLCRSRLPPLSLFSLY